MDGRCGQSRGVMAPEELRRLVNEYMQQCAEAEVFPDLAGMRLFLGLGSSDLEEMGRCPELKEILDYAADCRESWLVRRMTADNRLTSACINALRQSENGGYSDKPPQSRQRLVIEFSGNIEPEDFM